MNNSVKLIQIVSLALLFCGCHSILKYPPHPPLSEWGTNAHLLGVVKADSGVWPLSLNVPPPDYTYYAALREKAVKQFKIPASEVLLGEVTVEIGAEMVGTVRDWKASAEAWQK